MHKIHISRKWMQIKNMHKKCWVIQLFLESINNNSFPIMNCLSFVDFDKNINQMSLDSTVFDLFFFSGVENVKFSKTYHSQKQVLAKFSETCHSRKKVLAK